MDQIAHDVRRKNWLNIVTQCQNRKTDISIKQWLADNGIKEKAYYYWLRKFQREAYEQMQLPSVAAKTEVTFAEVPVPLLHSKSEKVVVCFLKKIRHKIISFIIALQSKEVINFLSSFLKSKKPAKALT